MEIDDLPAPPGFRLYNVETTADWRNRVGDFDRRRLSLSARGDDMSGLAMLPSDGLWRLEVRSRKVTDADFDQIARFESLEDLDLSRTKITDAAMLAVHTMQRLRVLHLAKCAITDAAMEHIAALRNLEHLDLMDTQVTDEGLRPLAFHPALKVLVLRGSKVTGERLAALVSVPKLRQLGIDRKQRRHAARFALERPDVEILY